MRDLLAVELRRQGYDVVEASDGVELLSTIQSAGSAPDCAPFDVIVSDINMPGLTGLDVLSALPSARWQPPVILITGYCNQATHTEALKRGAFATLEKPLSLTDLRAVLRRLPGPIRRCPS